MTRWLKAVSFAYHQYSDQYCLYKLIVRVFIALPSILRDFILNLKEENGGLYNFPLAFLSAGGYHFSILNNYFFESVCPMIYLIEPTTYELYRQELTGMYQLRHEVFFKKLKWQVTSEEGLEKDDYDEKDAFYLIYKDQTGKVRGCMRFIEMTNDCMFDGPFRFLLPNLKTFKRSGMWEISRFAVDYSGADSHKITTQLLAALYYFGLELQPAELFLSINYLSTIKLYQRYQLLGCQLAKQELGNESLIISGYFPLRLTYEKLLEKSGHDLSQPLFYHLSPCYAQSPVQPFVLESKKASLSSERER